MKEKYSDSIHTCQAVQLAAMDVLGDLTSNPDLVNVPDYKELAERMYMAARQAATVHSFQTSSGAPVSRRSVS